MNHSSTLAGCVGVLLLALSPGQRAYGQQLVPRYNLEATEEIPVGRLTAATIIHPIKCDSKGNIYVRFYQARLFSAPIAKFSSKGELGAAFSTEKVKGWEGADIYDFSVGQDGRVYLLVAQLTREKKLEFGLLGYGDDGHSEFSIPLEVPLDSPEHLEVFSTGEFLIAGFRKLPEPAQEIPGTPSAEQKKKEPSVEPAVLVVDRGGSLVKEVELTHISQDEKKAAQNNEPLRLPASAIGEGSTVAGEDGNIYVMFQAEKPKVYAISAKGEVVRILTVEPPSEKSVARQLTDARGVGLLLTTTEKADVRGSEVFLPENTFFSLVNPETGERLSDYQSSAKTGYALACYTPRGLLFFGSSEGKLVLRRTAFH